MARARDRWLMRVGFALISSCCSLACDDEEAPSTPTVSSDLSALRRLFPVPDGVTSARWLVRARRPPGSRLVPGPTDTLLFAYLETAPDFWVKQGYQLPALNTGAAVEMMVSDVKPILPASVLKESELKGDSYRLKCEPRATTGLSSVAHPCTFAARCGTGLLLVFEGN